MTFCLGIRGREGLIGMADTRVTTGHECITAQKLSTWEMGEGAVFIMTSGLRSLRDKVLTYFNEVFPEEETTCDRLYSRMLRQVVEEDRAAVSESGLQFNLFSIIGGQMAKDPEPILYLLYPAGNWVEIGKGTPYCVIGNSGYGKPILDRTLKHGDDLRHAFRVGCLAFDSTRKSAADVDFPVDVVLSTPNSFRLVTERYDKEDFADLSEWWQERLRTAIQELPAGNLERIFDTVPPTNINAISAAMPRRST